MGKTKDTGTKTGVKTGTKTGTKTADVLRNNGNNKKTNSQAGSVRSSSRSSGGGKKNGKDKQTMFELMLVIAAIALLVIYGGKIIGEQDGEETNGTKITAAPTKTPHPTNVPIEAPTPTAEPTKAPTVAPTPTAEPTTAPISTPEPTPTAEPSSTPTSAPTPTAALTPTQAPVESDSSAGEYAAYSNTKYAWWFIRKQNHEPSGSGEEFNVSEYGAYYRDKNVIESDKVIYLTFDCGYELGFTNTMLDTLAAHDAKAIFFVTKSFIRTNPELVIRMKEEGHMVGNHTVTHPSMPSKTISELTKEITDCSEYMYEQTGYQMDPYLRPPMGEYSERTLKLTQDLGYKSVFWSIAYYDYDADNQPGKQYVLDHFSDYHHNGAIPLIHNTSESNMEALDEVLALLEEDGYRFGTLDELD